MRDDSPKIAVSKKTPPKKPAKKGSGRKKSFILPDAPNFDFEQRLHRQGYKYVAGVDEAGRGPLAGPVVAAAVILDPKAIPEGLNDSKKLSEAKREILFEQIVACAHVSFCAQPPAVIDTLNILQANLRAMCISVARLSVKADFALFDGRDVPKDIPCPGEALIKGDARCLSIAAASIIAKVMRDQIMRRIDIFYPDYGFASHKGYGSKAHLAAIELHGPTPHHRMSFAPLKYL